MIPDRARAARELLAFYEDAGVDLAVGEEANNYLTQPAPITPALTSSSALPHTGRASKLESGGGNAQNGAAMLAPDAAVMAAREAARSAASLDDLRAILERFEGCALKATDTQLL